MVEAICTPLDLTEAELTAPAPDVLTNPWRGSELAPVQAHWSNPMKEAKPLI
jgi:hypothetical protein